MKDEKLNQILAALRHEPSPSVPESFADRVLASLPSDIRSQPVVIGFFDQLNSNFTRFAIAAAAAIVLCAALEIGQSIQPASSMDDDLEQICSDWMLR